MPAFLMEMVVIVSMNNSGSLCVHTCAVERQACERLDELSRAVCLVAARFLGNQGFGPFSDGDKRSLLSLQPIHTFILFEVPCF